MIKEQKAIKRSPKDGICSLADILVVAIEKIGK